IREIYKIEDETRDCSPAQRKEVRRQKAPALWLAMNRRADQLCAEPRFMPKSTLGKAVQYFLKEYTAMLGYLRDGMYEVDNNLVEGLIQSFALRFLCRDADNAEQPQDDDNGVPA